MAKGVGVDLEKSERDRDVIVFDFSPNSQSNDVMATSTNDQIKDWRLSPRPIEISWWEEGRGRMLGAALKQWVFRVEQIREGDGDVVQA